MAEKIYAQGLYGKARSTKYGEIVGLSFKAEEFISFLQDNANADGFVNVDLLKKREGDGMYGVLNTYVSKKREADASEDELF